MHSRASIAGHPIHPMLIAFPIGLWVFSFVADIIYLAGGDATWADVAYYTMAGGLVGALAAAIPGAIDLFSITTGHVRRIGLMHMAINLVVVLLYAINLGMRTAGDLGAVAPVWLSGFAIALLGVSGWLGGAMVYEHGVGVEDSAIKGTSASQERGKKPSGTSHMHLGR
jgi:uncharacterized membrane protein